MKANTTKAAETRILLASANPSVRTELEKVLSDLMTSGLWQGPESGSSLGAQELPTPTPGVVVDAGAREAEVLALVQTALRKAAPYSLALVDPDAATDWDGLATAQRLRESDAHLPIVLCPAADLPATDAGVRVPKRLSGWLCLARPFVPTELYFLLEAAAARAQLSRERPASGVPAEQEMDRRTGELPVDNLELQAEVEERMLAEEALRRAEDRYGKAFNASPTPLAILALDSQRLIDANSGFTELTGFARDELVGSTSEELKLWGEAGFGLAVLNTLRAQLPVRELPCVIRTRSGERRDARLSAEMLHLLDGPHVLLQVADVTEQRRVEIEVRQSQKMEAMGQFAAGMGHDFNNMLTVILGHTSLMLKGVAPGSREHTRLSTVHRMGERAAEVIKQLLAFSRKQAFQPQPIDFAALLESAAAGLRADVGGNIELGLSVARDLPALGADPAMLESVLRHLVSNARDAMPDGGRITVSARLEAINAEGARLHPARRLGRFVCLSVADEGFGIPPHILPRIFDPFFTTKKVGLGGGLGLSVVYGIVRQHKGWIELHSEVGNGTVFRVFLPLEARGAGQPVPTSSSPAGVELGRRVLLVEDEVDVRELAHDVLTANGYEILAAGSGPEALEIASRSTAPIDLLLTDIVLPNGMMGQELAQRLVEQKPSLRVIYTSGYISAAGGREKGLVQGYHFLPKPYSPARLLQVVEDCLGHEVAPVARVSVSASPPAVPVST